MYVNSTAGGEDLLFLYTTAGLALALVIMLVLEARQARSPRPYDHERDGL